MNKLKEKILVYDDNCPMCRAYSGWFVRWGWLPADGRCGYSHISAGAAAAIDHERYRTEIALVDTAGGATVYGLDAMLHIVTLRLPLLGPFFQHRPIYKFFKKLYRFISYNRRILAPPSVDQEIHSGAPPDSFRHHAALILFGVSVSILLTFCLGSALGQLTGLPEGKGQTWLLAGAGTGWVLHILQAFFTLNFRKAVVYTAHLAVIMMLGLFLQVPAILWIKLGLPGAEWIAGISLLISFFTMLGQVRRRTQACGLGFAWVISWAFGLGLCAIMTTLWAFSLPPLFN